MRKQNCYAIIKLTKFFDYGGEKMNWNIAPECISVVILSIIWIYSRKSNLTPTLRNILFQGCFLTTFTAVITNILSALLIAHSSLFYLTWIITTIYFIFTPLMGLVYGLYSASVIYEGKLDFHRFIFLWSIPGILYLLLVISNCFNKLLFDFNLKDGYSQGPLIAITYILFYFYCLLSVFFVIKSRHTVDSQVYHILSVFPVIAVIVIIIQQFVPSIILSGSAATCALLIIYLHLQNRQISIDYTTNLPNRLELLDMLDLLLSRQSQPFTLTVVSLRDFKQINDTFGQQSGDYLLKAIGEYLTSLSGNITVFRFKGDEFALLIKDNDLTKLKACIRQILKRFSSTWKVKEMDCSMACAIGIVSYPETAVTLENIILSVEDSIIRAKKEGLNAVCYFDKEMFAKLQRKKEIIQILKDKLKRKDFEIYYQPIISLKSGSFEYAESLMRINDSQIGPISPGEFIPIAEETGLIIDITYLILDIICKFIHDMLTKNYPLKCVHVNFSALQFKQPDLSEKILQIIKANNIPCSCIKIEFTESTVAENTEQVTQFACEMEKYGIFMGLDDFGTGYSNLSTVINLPFSTAKIDKSLVWAAVTKKRFALTVQNLIRIFKDLNMIVIAEGVETEEQNQFIIDSGADQIQGFYYSKPLSAEDMERFLSRS